MMKLTDDQKSQALAQAGWQCTDNGIWWLPGRAGVGKRLDEAYNYMRGEFMSVSITTGDPFSDLCWYCELCGTEVAMDTEDDPLPAGWKIKRMRTGIGMDDIVVCETCITKEEE